MDEHEIRGGFQRQRRNLVATSLALFVFEAAGLEFQQVSVLGNSAKLTNPTFVPVLLWSAWGYFLIRYVQFFRAIPEIGYGAAVRRRMQQTVPKIAFKMFKSDFEPKDMEIPANAIVTYDYHVVTMSGEHPDLWDVQLGVSVGWTVPGSSQIGTANPGGRYQIHGRVLRRARLRARLHAAWNHPALSEHIFPYVIAALPVVLWVGLAIHRMTSA
ncbi:MAG: hypothetical protein NXI30_17780 [bacterium]|nr:hypothetical protein [bacterium]